jgi:hypothetical protein
MEKWNDGILEKWVKKKVSSLSTIIPSFQYSFIKFASENPFLWTRMKDASAESRKQVNQMLNRVQHDTVVRFWSFLSSRT